MLPLHVFEPRYRQLVEDCLRDDLPLSIPQLVENGRPDAHGRPAVLPYATVGRIAAHHRLDDGRFNILVQPLARIRLLEEPLSDRAYRVVRAAVLQDLPVDEGELARAGERVRRLLAPMVARLGPPAAGLGKALGALPAGRVAEAVAGFVVRSEAARQAYLSQDDPLARARLVEEGVLTTMAEVQDAAEA
jgi:Lon protease-like protein